MIKRHLRAVLSAVAALTFVTGHAQDKKTEAKPERPAPERGTEPRTWMGVATAPVHPVLRQHLQLEEGFGVQITHVPEDGPAHAAGMMAGDILMKFADQRLISPEHLALLVRSAATGDEVEVTFIRKGSEQTVGVKLGENDLPPLKPASRLLPPRSGFDGPAFDWEQWRDDMQRYRESLEKHRDYGNERMPDAGRPPGMRRFRTEPEQNETRKSDSGSTEEENDTESPETFMRTDSVVTMSNDAGKLVLSRDGAALRVELYDAEGKTVYQGPFDESRGIGSLPESARRLLGKMKIKDIGILAPPAPAEEKSGESDSPPETASSHDEEEVL